MSRDLQCCPRCLLRSPVLRQPRPVPLIGPLLLAILHRPTNLTLRSGSASPRFPAGDAHQSINMGEGGKKNGSVITEFSATTIDSTGLSSYLLTGFDGNHPEAHHRHRHRITQL